MSFHPGPPWPVDVLTPDYLVSGYVQGDSQRWGWLYLQATDPNPNSAFIVDVAAVRSTCGLAALPWEGAQAMFAFRTAMIAIICRGPDADSMWDQYNGKLTGEPGVVIAGPYSISGTFVTQDSITGLAMLQPAIPARDVTVSRIDGRGDGAVITGARAMIMTPQIQAAAVHHS